MGDSPSSMTAVGLRTKRGDRNKGQGYLTLCSI